ncbi:MAG: hypothetical protein ACR2J8_07970, partial [Thermomicrobiales bacterium]
MGKLEIEHIVDGLVPSHPAIDPGGRWIVFVASRTGQPEEHPTSDLWLAPADGSEPPRQLTRGGSENCAPRWSSDGTAILFLSDRQERGARLDLYRLSLSGGEPEHLLDWDARASEILPLPDGQTIAILAPDAKSDEDRRREKERDDAVVHGQQWRPRRLRLLELASGKLRTIDIENRHIARMSLAPDGDRIAVVTWPNEALDHSMRDADLRIVDRASGESRLVCALPSGASALAWDPDEGRILFLAHLHPDWRGGMALWSVTLEAPVPVCLTPELEACPLDLWAGPEGSAWLLVAEGLDTWLGRVDGDRVERVLSLPGDASHLAGDRTGNALAMIRSTRSSPPNIWVVRDGGFPSVVTDLRPELADIVFGEQEPVSWNAADGMALDGLLILP